MEQIACERKIILWPTSQSIVDAYQNWVIVHSIFHGFIIVKSQRISWGGKGINILATWYTFLDELLRRCFEEVTWIRLELATIFTTTSKCLRRQNQSIKNQSNLTTFRKHRAKVFFYKWCNVFFLFPYWFTNILYVHCTAQQTIITSFLQFLKRM